MSDVANEPEHEGHVLEWHPDQGWGVLVSPSLPEPVWAHFSAIAGTGYRELTRGQVVRFSAEQAEQDSFRWRAVRVRLADRSPETDPGSVDGPGYSSQLHITFDE